MKSHTYTICLCLLGLCQFASAQYLVQPVKEPCIEKPIVSVSKVYETDASGKKPRGAKPVAIVETNNLTGISKVFEADARGKKPSRAKPVQIVESNEITGVSKIYEADLRGKKPYRATPDAIIKSNGYGVSRLFETDDFGTLSRDDDPVLIIETR